ncbi:expressed unknown protein [Seminavis robusta]|uniref:Uncharacterized protein n=1 Tax=Seminavis robusta TaxID=568900 RepID=A0A9N8DE79_9STRA|nr:expressed unknown protein [Seminavis robusta]|eukprot:Sro48_g028100.1 n/a (362) ;mRNA; f:21427-22512
MNRSNSTASNESSSAGGSSYMLELDNEHHDVSNLALPRVASRVQLYPTIETSDASGSSGAAEAEAEESSGLRHSPRHQSKNSRKRNSAPLLSSSLLLPGSSHHSTTLDELAKSISGLQFNSSSSSSSDGDFASSVPALRTAQSQHSVNSTPKIGFGLPQEERIDRLTPDVVGTNSCTDVGATRSLHSTNNDATAASREDEPNDKLKANQTIIATATQEEESTSSLVQQLEGNFRQTTTSTNASGIADYLCVKIKPDGRPYLQIGPDFRVDYIGTAAVTKKAIRNREPTLNVECITCQVQMTCLAKVDYVLCASCQTICPTLGMSSSSPSTTTGTTNKQASAGIGLRTEVVAALVPTEATAA